MTDDLKACPFCGSDDISDQGPSYTQIMCNHCGASTYDQASRVDAVSVWNKRAEEFKIGANDMATARTLANDAQYVSYEQTVLEIARALSAARSQAYEEVSRLIGEANARLGGIETPAMRGDNLAVTLCTHFDDGEPSDDDTGWSPAAIEGYEQVMAAIKDHYSQAIRQHSQKGGR